MRADFAKTVILDAYRGVGANAVNLLRAMWLPVLLGGLSLYISLNLYFSLLEKFLVEHNARESSLALAAAAAGIMLWFLFHAIGAMSALRNGFDRPTRRSFRLRIRRAELRMFAGILRFLAILAGWATFMVGAWYIADKFMAPIATPAAVTAFLIGAIVLWVRLVFLLPALVAVERVQVLRRAWVLTRGHLLPLLAVWLLVCLPPLLLMEVIGDVLLQTGLWGAPFQWGLGQNMDASAFAGIKALLPGGILTFSICTSLSLALTVMGSVSAYRQLTHGKS